MRNIHIIAATLFLSFTVAIPSAAKQKKASAGSVSPLTIIDKLRNVECYRAMAEFSVTMPQLNDDVVYRLDLTQRTAKADSLLPCSYLIDWTLTTRDNPIRGFSAYYDGNHYRYSGERLQEYHQKWDPVPFTARTSGPTSLKGVQRTAQFANLLPLTIAEELDRIIASESYTVTVHPDTIISGKRCIALEAIMLLNGVTAMEATYAFSPETMMPLSICFENNPGSVSEQTVNVRYTSTTLSDNCDAINEQWLMQRYTDVFENYRESNFRIENLPGTRLPGFALPTTTGERYQRRSADGFAVPTIVALLDTSHGYTSSVVASLRSAIDALPYNADLIMAFVDKHVDAIEEDVPELRPGEHLLMSAKPLVRDCGAASLPAIILVDADGVVRNIVVGYNNNLASDVIQKMALIPATPKVAASKQNKQSNNENFTTSPMETVHFKGQECHTYGTLPAVGTQAPDFNLTAADLSAVKSEDFKGKTIVLNIFPSLDTEVCARSVRRFNEEAGKLDNTVVVCVSQDLPFAMNRFCTIEGLKDVTPASAFRSPQFGEKYGVILVDGPLAGLLTRAVVIIGSDGMIKYRELVDEITEEPDYEAALRALKGI